MSGSRALLKKQHGAKGSPGDFRQLTKRNETEVEGLSTVDSRSTVDGKSGCSKLFNARAVLILCRSTKSARTENNTSEIAGLTCVHNLWTQGQLGRQAAVSGATKGCGVEAPKFDGRPRKMGELNRHCSRDSLTREVGAKEVVICERREAFRVAQLLRTPGLLAVGNGLSWVRSGQPRGSRRQGRSTPRKGR